MNGGFSVAMFDYQRVLNSAMKELAKQKREFPQDRSVTTGTF
jgi:hypothetical protein